MPAVTACLPGGEAMVTGRLYGSVEAPVDWRGPRLECEGMPRPDDGGLRLRFAQRIVPTQERLVIIIGIDEVGRDETAEGLRATVTIIDERNDRFFSNTGDNCWADVLEQTPLSVRPPARAIRGRVYCSTALAAVSGPGSVSLDELEFRGRVDWPGESGAESTP